MKSSIIEAFDLGFSVFIPVLVGVTAMAYAVRVLFWGRKRNERAESDGGSVLMSIRFMETGYWLLGPLLRLLSRLGVTPNRVTIFSLVPALGAAVAIGLGHLGLGGFLATAAAMCDMLDGPLARMQGSTSGAGAALDSVVDRVGEILTLGALVIYFRFSAMLTVLTIAALGAAFMVSYVSVKAEAMGAKPPRGAMRRAERAVYLIAGLVFTPILATGIHAENVIVANLPILGSLFLIAAVGSVSAINRTRAVLLELDLRRIAEEIRDAHAVVRAQRDDDAGSLTAMEMVKRAHDLAVIRQT